MALVRAKSTVVVIKHTCASVPVCSFSFPFLVGEGGLVINLTDYYLDMHLCEHLNDRQEVYIE